MSWSVKTQIVLLALLCVTAFFLRSYATYRDLIFAYDQGRDAIMMERIASGDLTLIGPVTGLDGVYLGPFWYYLLLPAYVIGQGNPVVAALYMKLFSVGVILLLYWWGRRAKLPWVGLLAGTIYAVSFQNILFARWLSNPVPLPFFALLGFSLLWVALERRTWWIFMIVGMIFGASLQLEAANAVWFIPTVGLILIADWFAAKWKTTDISSALTNLSIGGGLTLLPQILFELKNNFLLTNNLIHAFQTTHEVALKDSFVPRIELLLSLYGRGLFARQEWLGIYVVLVTVLVCIVYFRKLVVHRSWRIVAAWFFVPFFFHSIYTGNHGNFWDYYIIAQHVALVLLFSLTAGIVAVSTKWRTIVLCFCAFACTGILVANLQKWTEMIEPYPQRFSLQQQVDATLWMKTQANGQPYGAWVYTPSAQDDPYRYVFSYVGRQIQAIPEEHVEQQPVIFLVVEDDPVFWRRRAEWIVEKMKFGPLQARQTFGAITVLQIENTFLQKK